AAARAAQPAIAPAPSEMYIEQITPMRAERRTKQTSVSAILDADNKPMSVPLVPRDYDVPEHMKRGKRKRVLMESGGEAGTVRAPASPEADLGLYQEPTDPSFVEDAADPADEAPALVGEALSHPALDEAIDADAPPFDLFEMPAQRDRQAPDAFEMPDAPRGIRRDADSRDADSRDVDSRDTGGRDAAAAPTARPPIDRPALTAPARADAAGERPETDLDLYSYPPLHLLQRAKRSVMRDQGQRDREKAQKLEETLQNFNISADLVGIAHGPAVTRFELAPAPGIKLSRITALADDIALSLAALSVRIEAPIPGKAAVGIEIPNDEVEIVPLRDVLESDEARRHASRLAVALGKDNSGRFIIADLARMPHMLIAGSTGSGKSACINSIICSILYRATPDEVRLILVDPKMVELSVYNGIPHLLVPVVTEAKKAPSALTWAVAEMGNRYKMFSERGVREIKGYNLSLGPDEKPLPQIVIVIDELSDLMMIAPGEVEDSILRLSQLARAAGIHLVIATQRPSVNVVTGVIKVNIPSRIAFTVTSQVDSRTILDMAGAEKLLGRGDMLYMPQGAGKPHRVQGAWVSDEEVHGIVDFIKRKHDVAYDEDAVEHINSQNDDGEPAEEKQDEACDELLSQAIEMAVESGQASISMLQRRLRVGYARAGRLIDEMAARGIISQSEGAKPRTVLITREQFNLMFDK
ncbi:MAG: DNA translocase FtsK, partial [Clostridiales bacterium]|nr:DNA translocase FtsK [Clostridiales bacterium]